MFVATSATAFFNLLYQLVMLRLVPREVFTSLNSLLSLLVILSVPALAFTTMVAKHVSFSNAQGDIERIKFVWRKLMQHAFIFSMLVFFLIFLLRHNIVKFLHIESDGSVIILGGIFLTSCLFPVMLGGLQGLEKFKWIALISFSGGLLKLLFSVFLVKSALGMLNGALSGFLLAITVGILAAILPLRFLLTGPVGRSEDVKKLYHYIMPVLAVSFCFALFTNIDMVLVKHYFIVESQEYSIAQMIGKIIVCIPGMIYAVMFSRVSNLYALKKSSKDLLRKSLFFAFVPSFVAALSFNLAPGFFLKILVGPFNRQIILLGRVLSLAMLFYALSNILFYYQLSIERYRFIRPLIFMALLQVAAICAFHKSPIWVANIMLFNALAVFIFNLKSAFRYSV